MRHSLELGGQFGIAGRRLELLNMSKVLSESKNPPSAKPSSKRSESFERTAYQTKDGLGRPATVLGTRQALHSSLHPRPSPDGQRPFSIQNIMEEELKSENTNTKVKQSGSEGLEGRIRKPGTGHTTNTQAASPATLIIDGAQLRPKSSLVASTVLKTKKTSEQVNYGSQNQSIHKKFLRESH